MWIFQRSPIFKNRKTEHRIKQEVAKLEVITDQSRIASSNRVTSNPQVNLLYLCKYVLAK